MVRVDDDLHDTWRGHDRRERCASRPVPAALALVGAEDRALLTRWAAPDNERRSWNALLVAAKGAGIERANALCDRLLREGWLVRGETRRAGSWQWDYIRWRDLPALKTQLGLRSSGQREASRQDLLAAANDWLDHRRSAAQAAVLDPDLLDELERAMALLAAEKGGRVEVLQSRLALLRAVCDWHDSAEDNTRRDFALRAKGTTKGVSAAEWRWLATTFDLDRLGIREFQPRMALAGDVRLRRGSRAMDLGMAPFVDLPLGAVCALDGVAGVEGPIRGYWLIENRASFERQAVKCEPGIMHVWLPGRPSRPWLQAMQHLLALNPAPGRISADADPAGVDITCSVGRLWQDRGLGWTPHRMGLPEWESTSQQWPLNAHDRLLLTRLMASTELPGELRALCEAMAAQGRKAEQEAWL